MSEKFMPIRNRAPDKGLNKVLFFLRLLADFQTLTSYKILWRVLPTFSGLILDVGCGDSPYRHLLNNSKTDYRGLDIETSGNFQYANPNVVKFDGIKIPFESASADGVICTEVLEHVRRPNDFVKELYRVLKPGAPAVVTVPWSARFHYIPHDYFRYTPSALSDLFSEFSQHEIIPRGTEVTAIASKVVVLQLRSLKENPLIGIIMSPLTVFSILAGHLSLILEWGSKDDPVGYTILLKK